MAETNSKASSLPCGIDFSNLSRAELLALATDPELEIALAKLTAEQRRALLNDWEWFWSRPSQRPPEDPDWVFWLVRSGRGFGKTRLGAEWIRAQAKSGLSPLALIGAKEGEVRSIMIEGPSGILSVSPPSERPAYQPSVGGGRLIWPNGIVAYCYSAERPDNLRGPDLAGAWCDELAKWRYASAVFDQLRFTLRAGPHPRAVITTTPRPIKIIKDLIAESLTERSTVRVTSGSSYENRANLAPSFLERIITPKEGTRLGRQEIHGEILDDVEGALWNRDQIEERRWPAHKPLPTMARIIIALDPAVTSGEESDETGIIVCGKSVDGDGFVLDDQSGRYQPNGWAQKALELYRSRRADRIVAEVNNGGDLVQNTIRMFDKNVSFKAVHATRGRVRRAEPIAALYESRPGYPLGRVWHVGTFPELEDQMCELTIDFDPGSAGYSPDRADAMIWGFTDLMVERMHSEGVYELYRRQSDALAHPARIRVRMRPPLGPRIGHLSFLSKPAVPVGPDGIVEVALEDVRALTSLGWTKVGERRIDEGEE
jgi:phage terminase large subunit-like protein